MSNYNDRVRFLQPDDYHKGYLQLLGQLTICDADLITYESFAKQLELIERTGIKIFVLEDNNKIIATASLLIEPKFIHGLSNVGHIEDVVVSNDYRGLNIGKLIIGHLLNAASQFNCYKVILDCGENNVGFYEKCALQVKGVQMAKYFEKKN
jgi:glucosamine-phosphate N-acetyltransferase